MPIRLNGENQGYLAAFAAERGLTLNGAINLIVFEHRSGNKKLPKVAVKTQAASSKPAPENQTEQVKNTLARLMPGR